MFSFAFLVAGGIVELLRLEGHDAGGPRRSRGELRTQWGTVVDTRCIAIAEHRPVRMAGRKPVEGTEIRS